MPRASLTGCYGCPRCFSFVGNAFKSTRERIKAADYTTPYPFSSRWIDNAVLLNTRCDGSAHAGCQAGCMIFWKEAWLQPVAGGGGSPRQPLLQLTRRTDAAQAAGGCEEPVIWHRTQVTDPVDSATKFVCQTTELPKASRPLAWSDSPQYVEDVQSGT